MNAEIERWRADSAATLAGLVHLNNAGAALMPRPVAEAVRTHLDLELRIGGYEAADAAADRIARSYDDVARLVGAAARNIAIVENATVAFAQALSAFDFRRGDVILTTRSDYISNQLMYLSLHERLGVNVVRAEDTADGGVDPDSIRYAIRQHRPKLVALTWVPTNSGLVQPAEAVGEICAAEGVPYLIDACQAVGQIPIDVTRLKCDFLSATARKFLRGPRGIGFLYVSDRVLKSGRHPLYVDMRGARWIEADAYALTPDARRFENWEFAYALVVGMGEAARYALEVGVERGGARAAHLAEYARERLSDLDGVRVLDRGAELCAIVAVEVVGHDADDVVRALREAGINTSAARREHALIDMDDKRATTAVRISPHYYNTEGEIDALVCALEDLVRQRG